ncbi:3'(2'),5'-bisphosphate nucleotidase CysQ [Candidatus Woesearchaeota archaeon]|nr:3'(2'),5'-bisphosphate nucleotidase CysQ [Candidatus Woesearchaeota archaeon]
MQPHLDVALEIARSASEIALSRLGDARSSTKGDGTIVMPTDVEISNYIVGELERAFPRPEHVVVSEERADQSRRMGKEFAWYVDPIDGTKAFAEGRDEWSIMIGLVYWHQPFAGVVAVPRKKKFYYAALNEKAWLEEDGKTRKLDVSGNKLEEATLVLSRKDFTNQEEVEAFRRQFGVKDIVQSDSFGVKVGLIAERRADGYFNSSTKAGEWDVVAPEIILHEAGGRLTDFQGNEIYFNRNPASLRLTNGAVCSNDVIHEALVKRVQQYVQLK